ncbi:MAG: carboxypeptidase-like regulatory domain-containing protein [Candidatus Eremiobacteraeota bacterium]|nr:carboxypeptidase-like regulatory domain-containing protein [Candidatus Eremiobacteraeota bacterium]
MLASCSGGGNTTLPANFAHTSKTSKHILLPIALSRHKTDGIGGIPMGNAQVMLMDAAPSLGGQTPTEVDLGILAIEAVDSNGYSATLASYKTPSVINVLDYQKGSLALGAVKIPSGSYPKVRVLIDIATSHVVLQGVSKPINFDSMKTPAAALVASTFTGQDANGAVVMELTAPFKVADGVMTAFHLDFNGAESLGLDSDGNVYAMPALFGTAQDATFHGKVVNANGGPVNQAVVTAEADGVVNNIGLTGPDGSFTIHTLKAGTSYQIKVYNSFLTQSGTTLTASGQTQNAPTSSSGPTVSGVDGASLDLGTLQD